MILIVTKFGSKMSSKPVHNFVRDCVCDLANEESKRTEKET